MTVIRYKNRPAGYSFNNSLNDFLPQFPSLFKEDFKFSTPVNIIETTSGYTLEVIAPGFEKENFSIHLDKNILTVSAEKKEEGENNPEKFLQKEYSVKNFKRSFTLNEDINAEKIAAKYVNGVLILNLEKKEEVKPVTKQITVE
jgi:HSP20 family protein